LDSLGLVWKGGYMKDDTQPVSMVKREFSELSNVKKDFDTTQMAFIKQTLAPSLLDNEILLFIYRSQKLGLNPLNGEIFAYGSYETMNGEKVRKMVMIVARDGKRKIALQTGHLKSINSQAIYVKEMTDKDGIKKIDRVNPWEGGILWGASCIIKRDDYEEAFVVTVPLSEYRRETYIWKNKPETMIKKVAESQCLSQAFPELSGVYDESERWDDTPAERIVTIEGGDKPASEEAKETIKNMGGVLPENGEITRQEASDMIRQLGTKKGKK